ncbi:hypothetical protein [Streptomyces sp. B6B3]|uniref:hypothetical protein n=1 Tax=Streptomyces sp. B6B3 TaxID=3153570 RepID=UPI00325F12ED
MGEITVELTELLFPGVADVAITSVEVRPEAIRVAACGTASGVRWPVVPGLVWPVCWA